MAEEEKKTASSKVSAFLEKNRKCVIATLIVLIAALVVYIVVDVCSGKASEKGLAAVDEITYALTVDATKIEADEIETRKATAIEALAPLAKKGGVTGVRANLVLADLAYQDKNYEDALNYWKAVAAKGKKSYTAPIAYYNIASCYEALDNIDEAVAYYKKAADSKDFVLKAHAKFSYGRALEAKGDFVNAVAVYNELQTINPDDTWAKLAKTRLIKLQIEGKAE